MRLEWGSDKFSVFFKLVQFVKKKYHQPFFQFYVFSVLSSFINKVLLNWNKYCIFAGTEWEKIRNGLQSDERSDGQRNPQQDSCRIQMCV